MVSRANSTGTTRACWPSRPFLGPDHPTVLALLETQADAYLARKRYGDAAPLYKRLVTGSELTLGSGSPAFEALLERVAGIHKANGNMVEAESLYRRLLTLRSPARMPTGIPPS
jgi:tetratricopeptide (TPR) repeat protein